MRDCTRISCIIDDIYYSTKHNRPSKKVIFIIGDKIQVVENILNDKEADKKAKKLGYKKGSREYKEFRWRLLEAARFCTSNYLPSYSHCCIARLIKDTICSDLITTNYDQYFDEIWRREQVKISRNPVLSRGEYDQEGFYSSRRKKRCARYWKIHGTLSHVHFPISLHSEQAHLAKLPNLVMSSNYPTMALKDGLEKATSIAYHKGYEIDTHRKSGLPKPEDLSWTPKHFIDWSLKCKVPFSREIQGASNVLSLANVMDNIAAIIIVGFRVRFDPTDPGHPYNEEIAPYLIELLDEGYTDIYAGIHTDHFNDIDLPKSYLLKRLTVMDNTFHYGTESRHFFDKIIIGSKYFPRYKAKSMYDRWSNYWYYHD